MFGKSRLFRSLTDRYERIAKSLQRPSSIQAGQFRQTASNRLSPGINPSDAGIFHSRQEVRLSEVLASRILLEMNVPAGGRYLAFVNKTLFWVLTIWGLASLACRL